MKNIKEKDLWLILFVIGLTVLNYPFITIFNKDSLFYGFPVFFVYLFVGWIFSILVIYLYVKTLD